MRGKQSKMFINSTYRELTALLTKTAVRQKFQELYSFLNKCVEKTQKSQLNFEH